MMEDEDIVLCESPLHQYLEEVTDEPFEKYSPSQFHVNHADRSEGGNSVDNSDWTLLGKLDDLVNRFVQHNYTDSFNVAAGCCTLFESSLLCEEEEHLLLDLKEHVDQLAFSKNIPDSRQPTKTVYTNTWLISCIVVLVSVLLHFFFGLQNLDKLSFLGIFLVLLSVWFLLCGRKKTKDLSADMLDSVQHFSDLFCHYNVLIDRVIRHVRETEIIMHGYSQINKFNATIPRTGQKCIRLRCCLIDGLTDLFHQLRVNTRILMGSKRNNVLFDYKEEYIATMPLDTFSQVLYSTNIQDSEECQSVPALEKLKAAVSLYRFQMSEYVYMVVVLLFTLHHRIEMRKHTNDILFSIKDLNGRIENIAKSLEEQLNASVKLVFEKKEIEALPERRDLIKPTCQDILRSAEVNLHAALARIEDLKNIFDANSDNSDSSSGALNNLIGQFVLSIENARYCIEEITENNQPKGGHADHFDSKPNVVSEDGLDDSLDDVLFPGMREELGDMLYEGESEYVDTKQSWADDDVEGKLRETHESRRLMKELKTILSVKESPVGLMKFPLTKPTVDENPIDSEFSCGDETGVKPVPEPKRSFKSAYEYDPVDGEEETNIENFALPSIEQIRLPAFSGKFSMEEVVYGSSDDENDEIDEII